jgi:twinkle protein
MSEIAAAALRWFEKRGIDAETVVRSGIYTVAKGADGELTPSATGNVIVFPYLESGKEVAAKYRAAGKRFWQKAGARKTFFNDDVLLDPSLASGDQALVITEGEMDCLSCLQAGYPFAVSVPDGAPPARDASGKLIDVPEGTADVDPDNDEKYRYIVNNWEALAKVKRIVIATDGDEPGVRLAAELVRRLGRVRCYFVAYPKEAVVDDGEGRKRPCKDLNEVLLAFGAAEVVRIIASATPYPVAGVYRLSAFPQEPDLMPVSTGWEMLDDHLKVYAPAFMVVSGVAGAGKSSWANQLVANLALRHEWTIAIASFEMRVRPYVTDTLCSVLLDEPRRFWTQSNRDVAAKWMENRFVFIAPEPDDEATHDINWLLERAEVAVIRHGARVLLIDPWNEIEHERRRDESISDYTGRAIRELKSFGRRFDVLVIVVAHPTKNAVEKGADKITLYDISDSSAFANKADIGVIIARLSGSEPGSSIIIRKIRYQPDAGRLGTVDLFFDEDRRIFLDRAP